MRRHQQRQILELLKTIEEVQSEGLFADCQYGAIQIGEFIEKIERMGTQTVALLEEYCDLLFKASKGEIKEKHLRKHLIKVENSVRTELRPNKFEVVFISYKASMSDSIESIYFAAKSDPDCDVYWIPVPYYDRNSDGSFGQMHYEGADYYGSDIECVDWQQYDIEARHPDVIFTFNPYDGGNLVTSIHPNFYCERLRNLTELLIYVPYFVAEANAQEHFCTLAGCVFAHKVILQSKKVRDTYIRVFKEAYGNKFGKAEEKFLAMGSPKYDRIFKTRREDCNLPEALRDLIGDKKIIFYNTSLGSMLTGNEAYLKKLENVLETFRKRDDVVLWWRPHPLSHATYASMLPQLLNKYEQIVANYRRDGWDIYDDSSSVGDIGSEKKANLFFDNTPDLHRTIAWSDAYYGDVSSVTELVVAAGKMVMFQSINNCPAGNGEISLNDSIENYENYLSFDAMCEVDDYYYVPSLDSNRLFKINKRTHVSELVGFFPIQNKIQWRLYNKPSYYAGQIYFPPNSAHEIAIFKLSTGTFQLVDIPEPPKKLIDKYNTMAKFSRAVEHNGFIYLLPISYPGILELNPRTLEICVVDDWVPDVNARSLCDDVAYCNSIVLSSDKKEWLLPSQNANVVLRFDLDKKYIKINELPEELDGYIDIIESDTENEYWLISSFRHDLVKWNIKTNEIQKFPFGFIVQPYFDIIESRLLAVFGESAMRHFDHYAFGKIVRWKDYLYLFPKNYNRAIKFDIELNTFSNVAEFAPSIDELLVSETPPEEIQKLCRYWLNGLPFYNIYHVDDDRVIMHSQNTNKFIEFNLTEYVYREKGIEISAEDRYKIKGHMITMTEGEWQKPHKSVYEFTIDESSPLLFGLTLDEYVTALSENAEWLQSRTENMRKFWSNRVNNNGAAGNFGKCIYEFVKNKYL